jgi:glutamate-1-semialdehyde aminotransferase
VIPFNDPAALERALQGGDVACFIIEPVMQNIGICLPEPDYLEAVRDITERYGTLLIFDEVKTGITAGYGGALISVMHDDADAMRYAAVFDEFVQELTG